MNTFINSRQWYAAGLAFECTGCGRCCSGPEDGYVWLTQAELDAIAASLQMTSAEFATMHVKKVGKKMTLKMHRDNKDCPFLLANAEGKRQCSIYELRPTQCRTWPFWQANIEDPDSWSTLAISCPGVNRGKLHDAQQIQKKANMTNE